MKKGMLKGNDGKQSNSAEVKTLMFGNRLID